MSNKDKSNKDTKTYNIKSKNNPLVPDNSINITPDENKQILNHMVDVFNMPNIDINNPIEVNNRIIEYFGNCIKYDMRPGNMGLYAALNINRQEAFDILHKRKRANPQVCDMLKKACDTMALYREQLGVQGKVNPVLLIFWQKNYDGLKDQQDIVVQPAGIEAPEVSREQLIEQYGNKAIATGLDVDF